MSSHDVRVRVLISGYVQGVGFRYSAYHVARQHSLRGWVRNLPDGRVELEAEGDESAMGRFVAWCRHGPPGASVDNVALEWLALTGAEAEFTIGRTPLAY